MGKMKLHELVNYYHIGTDLSCAEAMFMACNEYYHLNLSEETRKMFSVMGLGMQTEQSCCGAFTVALHCVELQDLEIVGYENPCHAIVEALARKLEELLSRMGR